MFSFFRSKSNLSTTAFANKYFYALKKKVPGLQLVSINGLEVITKVTDANECRNYLDNAFAEYRNDPKNLSSILEKYTNSAKDLFLPEEPVQMERIVPVIKDYRFMHEVSKINERYDVDYIYEQYNQDLYIFYAEDKENSISYLSKDNFDRLNMELEQLKAQAIENLDAVISKMERHGENGYFMVTAGGDYEASLILSDIWSKDNFPVNGELLIGIPSRDLLLVAGTEDADNIEKLANTIREINRNGDHIVSDKIFALQNGKFEVWK